MGGVVHLKFWYKVNVARGVSGLQRLDGSLEPCVVFWKLSSAQPG